MEDILSDRARLSLYKKSATSGISTGILEEVYRRGYDSWDESFDCSPEQLGFDRVNSFIADGFAAQLDEDLKKACWKGYEAIGTKKKNGKTVPNCVKEADAEAHSTNSDDPASRFVGSNELTDVYKKDTPGYSKTYSAVKKAVKEHLEEDWQSVNRKDKTDGLSQKAVDAYRRENPGSKLKTAVTEKNPTGKRASRRKSFCSRMGGMKKRLTSAKTARDPDSRINKALRRWNCREETINEAGAGVQAATAPAPTAADAGPSKLGRNARVELSRRAPAGGDGLRNVGNNRYSASSPSNLKGGRTMTSGTTSATAKTLTPQRVSANQPAPKTAASTPASSSKPTARFGSTSKPTSVSSSIKTQVSTSTTPSGGKAPAPSAPTTKGIVPKGAEVVKSGTKGLGALAGKAAGAAALVGAGAALGKATADRYKEQHGSGSLIPHKETPGVSAKQSFDNMRSMKAPAAPKATGTISVDAPKKISGQYKGSLGDTTVKKGDTLSGIAKKNNTSVSDLMNKNKGILNADKVRAGSKIFTKDAPTPPKRPTMEETINELSPETLGSYVTKAEKEMGKIKAKDPLNSTFGDTDTYYKRKAGVELAKTKMEESE